MFEWFANNWGSILVATIVALVAVLIIVKMRIDKKKGKTSCGCGCANCAMNGTCHQNEK